MRWAVSSGCEMCLKQPKFNNVLAIIVLREQKQLGDLCIGAPTTLELHPDENFFLANFTAIVRWAVREKAKVQQCTCHYCSSRAKQLVDWWIAAPTTQERRHGVNFLPNFAAVVRWAVREKANSPTIHVPLLSQRLTSSASAWIFFTKFCHLAS